MERRLADKVCLAVFAIIIILITSGCSNGEVSSVASQSTTMVENTNDSEIIGNIEYVEGKVYTFDKNDAYHFSKSGNAVSSDEASTYGMLSISGTDLSATGDHKSGVAEYSISTGTLSIRYTYSDEMLRAKAEEWHLVDDNIKSIDIFQIGSSLQQGAIILQKSMDHLNWYNVSVQTNAFKNTPVQNGILYETTDLEMINGCYYRLIVAYETAIKVGTSTIAFVIPKDEIKYKRTAEVYEFYVLNHNEHIEPLAPNTKRYSLGETTLVSDFASYSGEKEIGKDDLHYGWKLGNFFVSGFTSTAGTGDDIVFLKNPGDVVTLWFNLGQNISALNHDDSMKITADSDGYDRYFQTPVTNFGKGMLIIRYTDYENVQHDPVMYYDYLLANTVMGANTRVQLFEEGDYEVALDYEVTKSQLISPQVHHYRIFFKFSVRNANCMVYPFDTITGAELANSAVTEHGFCLDLAKSRYLQIYIKKEVWAEGAEGLVEDTRFHTAAKDGDRYTDEGIYTITVKNKYTGMETAKKIYVGTNRILMAYAASDYTIDEIQQLVAHGATIYEDGTIEIPEKTSIPEPKKTETGVNPLTTPVSTVSSGIARESHETIIASSDTTAMITTAIPIILIAAVAVIVFARKNKGKEKGE